MKTETMKTTNTITSSDRNTIAKNGINFLHGKGMKELSFSGTLKDIPELNAKQGTILAFIKQEFASLEELKQGSFIRTSKIVNRFNSVEIFGKEGTIKKFSELLTPNDIKKVLQYSFLTTEFNSNGLMLAYTILKNGDTEFVLVNKVNHYVTLDCEVVKTSKSGSGSNGSSGSESVDGSSGSESSSGSNKYDELLELLNKASELSSTLNLDTVKHKINASIAEFELITTNKNATVTKKTATK